MICLFYIQLLSIFVCPDIHVILIKKQVAQSNGLIAPKLKKNFFPSWIYFKPILVISMN